MARIKYETDASQSVRAQKALTDAQEKYNKAIEETPQKLSRAEKAARRLAEQADPQAKYNRQMFKLAEAVEKGGLEQEKALRLTEKYQRQLENAGKSGQAAFGDRILTSIGSMYASLVGVDKLVGAISKGFESIEQTAQGAADRVFTAFAQAGELQQLTDDPAKFGQLTGYARELVRRGVFSPDQLGSAFSTSFSLESAGFSEREKEYFARLGESGFISAEGLVNYGGALRKAQNAYGGAGSISVEELSDRIIATSKATLNNASETAQAFTQFASGGAGLGYTGDAQAAALQLVDEYAKDINDAGVKQGALFTQIAKRGLNAGSLIGTIDSITSQVSQYTDPNEREAALYQILGESNAVKAYQAIAAQRDQFDTALANISGAGGTFARSSGLIDQDPELAAARQARLAAGELADASRGYGTAETLYKAISDQYRAAALRRGDRVAAALGGEAGDFTDRYGLERQTIVGAVYDESLPLELRLQAARYGRNTVDQPLFRPESVDRREQQQLDRMVSLLEQQLQEQRNANAGGGTKQEN